MSSVPSPFGSFSAGLWGSTVVNGECVFPRASVLGNHPLVSGTAEISFFQAQVTQAVSWVLTQTGDTAASGLTAAQVGVYSIPHDAIYNINQNLTCTLLAHVSDLTLWTSTFSPYSRQLSSSYAATAGSYYGVAVLAVGTTAPSLQSVGNFGFVPPYLGSALPGISTLPSTWTLAAANDPDFLFQASVSPVNIQ